MSELVEKVEKHISEKLETYLAEGIEEDLFLKFCATNAIRTVLEEMLKWNVIRSDIHPDFNRAVKKFAQSHDIFLSEEWYTEEEKKRIQEKPQ